MFHFLKEAIAAFASSWIRPWFLKRIILWNFIIIYEALLLILVSSQSYLKIKSIANLVCISIDYGPLLWSN